MQTLYEHLRAASKSSVFLDRLFLVRKYMQPYKSAVFMQIGSSQRGAGRGAVWLGSGALHRQRGWASQLLQRPAAGALDMTHEEAFLAQHSAVSSVRSPFSRTACRFGGVSGESASHPEEAVMMLPQRTAYSLLSQMGAALRRPWIFQTASTRRLAAASRPWRRSGSASPRISSTSGPSLTVTGPTAAWWTAPTQRCSGKILRRAASALGSSGRLLGSCSGSARA